MTKTFSLNALNSSRLHYRRALLNGLWLLAGFIVLAVLTACGGGGGVAGNGTGATETGNGAGTVTGFGSVIIDGVRFDDSAAAATIERTADDSRNNGVRAEIKLGHRLAFAFDGKTEGTGKVRTLSVEPTLIGRVQALGTNNITVLGQVVTFNDVASVGPVTQFEPSRAAATAVSGLVEVHAMLVGTELVATRVEATGLGALRVSGVVSNLFVGNLGVTRFTVAGVTVIKPTTAGSVVPSTSTLTNGQTVAVFADAGDFNETTRELSARRVRINTVAAGGADDYLSGVISSYVAGDSFKLNGLTVRLAAGVDLKPSNLVLANGQYVRIRGKLGTDNSVTATRVQLRSVEDSAELHGSVVGYTTVTGGGAVFSVRDVRVTMPANVTLNPLTCPAGTVLGDGLSVEVKGDTTATGVTAISVKCEDTTTGIDPTVERSGKVKTLAADNSATVGAYVITTSSGDLTVKYDKLTFFRSPLNSGTDVKVNTNLEVEGRLVTSAGTTVLQASKIKLEKTN
jgi:hypothetical protein